MPVTRNLLRRGTAAGLALLVSGGLAETSSAATRPPDAPHLPPGFGKTFSSRFVDAGGLRQHIVIGGDGPPLLLVHGWPENWYQYRALMPALARDFTVIAVDQRGMGLTEKAERGYDSATLANDLVALMDALGYERFSVVGLDTGMVIGYALAADHPERVARLVVGEAPLPGVTNPPLPAATNPPLPLFLPGPAVPRLWHLTFNRLDGFNERLVRGREDLFFGFIFDAEATVKLPDDAVRYYADGFASSPAALRGSFGFYRAWDATSAQNQDRAATKLTMPVLAIGGGTSSMDAPEVVMKAVANDVRGLVIPGAGHFLAEEAPGPMLAALTGFMAPYRDGAHAVGRFGARPAHPTVQPTENPDMSPVSEAGTRDRARHLTGD
jgi:pimeloyl-ACP methyl ester carboxylesterase